MFARSRTTDMVVFRLWHAALAGSFLVAYLTGDEDTYACHQFSGYAMSAVLLARLPLALTAAPTSPLRLPRPSIKGSVTWLRQRRGRNPGFAWIAATILIALLASAVSGVAAEDWPRFEHPHEAIANFTLVALVFHALFVIATYAGRRLRDFIAVCVARVRPLLLIVLCFAVVATIASSVASDAVAAASDPARAALLAEYAAEARAADSSFAGFSAARGGALFNGQFAGGDARTPSCTSCHTNDPRQNGRNAKTGRPIDPVAVSVNARRFVDRTVVEKQFTHDCKSVLGRACTPQEKGDYITFMAGQ